MSISYKLNAILLSAVNIARGDEQTRPYLHGVHVFPTGVGVGMVATDGRRMICANDLEGYISEAATLSLDKPLLSACKQVKCKNPWLVCEDGERQHQARLEIHEKDAVNLVGSGVVSLVDGEYPDFLRVIPSAEDVKPQAVMLNGKFLADFNQASIKACVATDGRLQRIRTGRVDILGGNGPSDPILIGLGTSQAFGVVMPIFETQANRMKTDAGLTARAAFVSSRV